MADEGEEGIFDNWEDLVDDGVLDKKIEEMKSRQSVHEPVSNLQCPLEPVILNEEVSRTQYVHQQPQVKILKRPSATRKKDTVLMNGEKVSKQPIKTLQQREAEYAEARLRILGAAKNEEELAEERLANITLAAPNDSPKETEAAPHFLGLIRHESAVQIIRPPRGPDGTNGFNERR